MAELALGLLLLRLKLSVWKACLGKEDVYKDEQVKVKGCLLTFPLIPSSLCFLSISTVCWQEKLPFSHMLCVILSWALVFMLDDH